MRNAHHYYSLTQIKYQIPRSTNKNPEISVEVLYESGRAQKVTSLFKHALYLF